MLLQHASQTLFTSLETKVTFETFPFVFLLHCRSQVSSHVAQKLLLLHGGKSVGTERVRACVFEAREDDVEEM